MRPVPGVSRTVGAAAGSMLALALLVCGCVFAALAGPALSQHTRTQALHQNLAGLSATTKTVQAGANWSDFTGPLVQNGIGNSQNMTVGEFGQVTREIGHGFAALGLPLAAGQWGSLSTNLFVVVSGAGPRTQTGLPPKLEVLYRDPLTSNAQLTAGAYAGGAVPAGMLAVAATTQTAARFGLHPGSRLSVATPAGPVGLFVTAIVRERGPGSTFWTQDSTAGTPALQQLTASSTPFWVGGLFADPDQLAAMQSTFTGPGMELNWEFPLDPSKVTADQAQGLDNALNRATTTPPTQNGMLAPVSCCSAGVPAVGSCVQKVEPGARSRTIAVTRSPTEPDEVVTDRRLPGCNPNRAAIWVVAATATIPAGTAPPAYAPAVSWALLVSGSR